MVSFISILSGSFSELRRNPILFIPKMISVTIWLLPYLYLLQQAKFDLAAAEVSWGTLSATALIFLISPIWLLIDSMYPLLVEQQKRTKRLDFRAALNGVLAKFLKILGMFFAIVIVLTVLTLPFVMMIAFGYVTSFIPLLLLGSLGIVALMFIGGIALYFVPTSLILEKIGIIESFGKGFGMARQNFSLVFWLTLVSLFFFALSFFLEGSLEALGVIGFIAGRYLGGIVTVYMYVINPAAYLEVKKK